MEKLIKKMNLNKINVEGDFMISKEQLETFAKEYHKEQLMLGGVNQQRELLDWLSNEPDHNIRKSDIELKVKEYLSNDNFINNV